MAEQTDAITRQLLSLQDETYRRFQQKLMPTVAPEAVIGVRMPQLRSYARTLYGTPEATEFLTLLPHRYYEENNLHVLLLENTGDYDAVIHALDAFLPYVDNWATCDLISPRVFSKHLPELYEKIKSWISSGQVYTIRFGIEMLMRFYLDTAFSPKMLELAASVRSEEYYVNMMIAWYFATALAKQYASTLPFLEARRLSRWTHNKTIQKAMESFRVPEEHKATLRTLKLNHDVEK